MLKPRAGLQHLADDQADGQRHRRDRLEIDQRLQPDPADALQVAHRGDAVHHGAEDHRRDHHLDQRDEAVAERLQCLAEIADRNSRSGCRARSRSAPGCRGSCTRADDGGRRERIASVVMGRSGRDVEAWLAIMMARAGAADNEISRVQPRFGISSPRCTAGRASPRSSHAAHYLNPYLRQRDRVRRRSRSGWVSSRAWRCRRCCSRRP